MLITWGDYIMLSGLRTHLWQRDQKAFERDKRDGGMYSALSKGLVSVMIILVRLRGQAFSEHQVFPWLQAQLYRFNKPQE